MPIHAFGQLAWLGWPCTDAVSALHSSFRVRLAGVGNGMSSRRDLVLITQEERPAEAHLAEDPHWSRAFRRKANHAWCVEIRVSSR